MPNTKNHTYEYVITFKLTPEVILLVKIRTTAMCLLLQRPVCKNESVRKGMEDENVTAVTHSSVGPFSVVIGELQEKL